MPKSCRWHREGTVWWRAKVQDKIKAIHMVYKGMIFNYNEEDKERLHTECKAAKKVAKRAVEKIKDGVFENLYKALDEKDEDRLLYCLARTIESRT